MRTVAFILARAGSKGLPGKNIKPLAGKPLILWAADCAKASGVIDEVIVSTDGEKIADVARQAGVKVMMRPHELAHDTAMPKDAIRYHLDELEKQGETFDIIVLLQPTSPLREPEDIQACVSAITSGDYDSATTFQKSPSGPYKSWRKTDDGPKPFVEGFDPWQPRQKLEETYALNGAVYASKRDLLVEDKTNSFIPGRAKMVIMPDERSLDIDTALDFALVERVLDLRGK